MPASWTTYRGLNVPDSTTGDAGTNLKGDLQSLADRDVLLAGGPDAALGVWVAEQQEAC